MVIGKLVGRPVTLAQRPNVDPFGLLPVELHLNVQRSFLGHDPPLHKLRPDPLANLGIIGIGHRIDRHDGPPEVAVRDITGWQIVQCPEDHPLVVSAKKRLGLKDTDGGLLRKWREVLSEPEYRVMVLLYESRGDVDRSRIASALWGIESDERYSDGAITQAVRRIRKKLLAIPEEKARIRTVYGKGYRLEL